MKVIIIGASSIGFTLSNLLGEGYEITLVENDPDIAKSVANETSALVIQGDGTDVSILTDIGIEKADAFIATTHDDTTNLMVCEIAKSEGVKNIISIVNKAKNEELFIKLGITRIVSLVGMTATAIKRMLVQVGDERIIAQFGDGDAQIFEYIISKDSQLIGKSPIIKDAIVATIYRSGELIIPKESSILEEGDVIVVATKTENLRDVVKLINGA